MSLNHKLTNLLSQAGLSESEILVYIELHRKPAQTKWEIVQRTGLNRNTVYRAFDKLESLKMIENTKEGLKASSLKNLVLDLQNSSRKKGKLARKIKDIAPFLHAPIESVEEIETFYDAEQIKEPYIKMSEVPHETCLDFGDFDSFIPKIGGLDIACKYRGERAKKAGHHAICTSFGKYSEYFSTRDSAQRFKTHVERSNLDFKNKWIIFSDTNDYVFFSEVKGEDIMAVLIKSKLVADMQRAQFSMISHEYEKR